MLIYLATTKVKVLRWNWENDDAILISICTCYIPFYPISGKKSLEELLKDDVEEDVEFGGTIRELDIVIRAEEIDSVPSVASFVTDTEAKSGVLGNE